MNWSRNNNIGSYLAVKRASDNASATAAGSGDATEVTGSGIDRSAIGMPVSAILAVSYKTVLAAAKTLSVAAAIDDSPDGTTWTVYTSAANAVLETAGTGALTARGVLELSADLQKANRYVRARFTPDLSATGTDTAELAAAFVFGGFQELPQ